MAAAGTGSYCSLWRDLQFRIRKTAAHSDPKHWIPLTPVMLVAAGRPRLAAAGTGSYQNLWRDLKFRIRQPVCGKLGRPAGMAH